MDSTVNRLASHYAGAPRGVASIPVPLYPEMLRHILRMEYAALHDLVRESTSAVHAVTFIRSMKSSSPALLVGCDDGHFYVLKIAGDAEKPNLLANELIGAVLAASTGLPVARTRFISVDALFLSSLPQGLFSAAIHRYQLRPGIHLGSRFIGDVSGPGRPLQYLSGRQLQRVVNKDVFVGMYLFDRWAQQCASRKALFVATGTLSQLVPVFFNHAMILGGPDWNTSIRHRKVTQQPILIYDTPPGSVLAVRSWMTTFQKQIPPLLSSLFASIPGHWYCGDLMSVHENLRARLNELPLLFEPTL